LATDFEPASKVNVVINPATLPGGLEFDGQWSISSMDTDPSGVNGPVYEDLHVSFDVMSASLLPIVTVYNATNHSTIAGGTITLSATYDTPCAVPGNTFADNREDCSAALPDPSQFIMIFN